MLYVHFMPVRREKLRCRQILLHFTAILILEFKLLADYRDVSHLFADVLATSNGDITKYTLLYEYVYAVYTRDLQLAVCTALHCTALHCSADAVSKMATKMQCSAVAVRSR